MASLGVPDAALVVPLPVEVGPADALVASLGVVDGPDLLRAVPHALAVPGAAWVGLLLEARHAHADVGAASDLGEFVDGRALGEAVVAHWDGSHVADALAAVAVEDVVDLVAVLH